MNGPVFKQIPNHYGLLSDRESVSAGHFQVPVVGVFDRQRYKIHSLLLWLICSIDLLFTMVEEH